MENNKIIPMNKYNIPVNKTKYYPLDKYNGIYKYNNSNINFYISSRYINNIIYGIQLTKYNFPPQCT